MIHRTGNPFRVKLRGKSWMGEREGEGLKEMGWDE